VDVFVVSLYQQKKPHLGRGKEDTAYIKGQIENEKNKVTAKARCVQDCKIDET